MNREQWKECHRATRRATKGVRIMVTLAGDDPSNLQFAAPRAEWGFWFAYFLGLNDPVSYVAGYRKDYEHLRFSHNIQLLNIHILLHSVTCPDCRAHNEGTSNVENVKAMMKHNSEHLRRLRKELRDRPSKLH